MYYNGQGVAQDDSAAMKWYRMAADQEMHTRSAISGAFTTKARAYHKTHRKHCDGFIKHKCRETKKQNKA